MHKLSEPLIFLQSDISSFSASNSAQLGVLGLQQGELTMSKPKHEFVGRETLRSLKP